MLAGLKDPSDGEIWFGDDDVTFLPSEKRGIGLVFKIMLYTLISRFMKM